MIREMFSDKHTGRLSRLGRLLVAVALLAILCLIAGAVLVWFDPYLDDWARPTLTGFLLFLILIIVSMI